MVYVALPTGSLQNRTLDLFRAAHIEITRSSSRSYRGGLDVDGVTTVAFHKPREIPTGVADGVFDVGISGDDWLEETGAKTEVLGTLNYAKSTSEGWRLVLAIPAGHPAESIADLPSGLRVATEYPNITARFMREHSIDGQVVTSFGATESKVPEIASAVVDVVETGATLLGNDLRVLHVVKHCSVKLIANVLAWADPGKNAAIARIATLLNAAQNGASHRLLTVCLPAPNMPRVLPLLPERWWYTSGPALENDTEDIVLCAVFPEWRVSRMVPALHAAGAVEVLEHELRLRSTTSDGGPK